jgi:hypothetical protein
MRAAENEKMIGQSLKGRKLTLKPVNSDMTASATRATTERRYTAFAAGLAESIKVTVAASLFAPFTFTSSLNAPCSASARARILHLFQPFAAVSIDAGW